MGDSIPPEIADFEVCSAFGMSWPEWKLRTPAYVQRVWTDLLAIKRRAENAAADRRSGS